MYVQIILVPKTDAVQESTNFVFITCVQTVHMSTGGSMCTKTIWSQQNGEIE